MGNSTSSFNKNFLSDWVQIEREQSFESDKIIWAKANNRAIQMEEYTLNVTSKEDLEEEQRIHTLRQNHPQLVSSLHFKDETEEEFCASNYKGKIYIERIPLTLQSITDIPFPDALHIYSQSLQGFHALTNQVESGCFPVSQEHIGINCESVCKVWMNNKFNRNYPSRNQRIMEERMVKIILDTIQENSDLGSLQGVPSPTQYIYSKAKSASEVKFGEAINLLRNYANEFFGGVIPEKLSCVDKVGGAFLLSKNWKGQQQSNGAALKRQGQALGQRETFHSYTQPQYYPASVPINTQITHQNQNYTAFKRQQPIQRPIPITQTPVQGSIVRNQIQNNQNIKTPSFHQSQVLQSSQAQGNFARPVFVQGGNVRFGESNVVTNVPNTQQVQYRVGGVNVGLSEMKRSQFSPQTVSQVPQVFQIQQQGSQVNQGSEMTPQVNQGPHQVIDGQMRGSRFLTFSTSPRQQIRQNLIQNRVQQVTSQKGIIFQSFSAQQSQLQTVIQQQQQQQRFPLQQQGQPITFNQVPQQQSISSTFQQSKTTVTTISQPSALPSQQTNQPISMINNNQLQKVNSKLVFIDKTSSSRYAVNEQVVKDVKDVKSGQQIISNTKQQYTDYSSTSYYAFTSKLYDTESPTKKQPLTTSPKVNNTFNFQTFTTKLGEEKKSSIPVQPSKSKYSVNLDDGMSSADFLNSLKTMKFTPTTTKNYDFTTLTSNKSGSYLNNLTANNNYTTTPINDYYSSNKYNTYNINSQQQLTNNDLKQKQLTRQQSPFDYSNKGEYTDYNAAQVRDDEYGQDRGDNDLVVIGSKLNITSPLLNDNSNNNRQFLQFILRDQPHYRMSYQYQQGENLQGDIQYESQTLQLEHQSPQNYNYQSNSNNYQSVFDKYASISQNSNRLGDNIQTQYTINNADEQQIQKDYVQVPLSNQPEEYKVDFDPEILADLERLKGAN